MKIYVVTPATDTFPAEYARRVDMLEEEISRLAAERRDEVVYLHDRLAPVLAAPAVYLECSDTFLNGVRKLPRFYKVIELKPDSPTKTVRRKPTEAQRSKDAEQRVAREEEERKKIAHTLKSPVKFRFKK